MALARQHLKPLADGEKISLIDILGVSGLYPGRVFWVAPTTMTAYAQFFKDHNVVDEFSKTNSVYNTVDAAISACVSGRGDVIYVAPTHTETVTATSIAHDVKGVKVVGLGTGTDRPTFTFGAAAATITVSAANCGWTNCKFVANFLSVASAFTLSTAKDFVLDQNSFVDTSSVLDFLSIVTTGATDNDADGLTVTNNYVDSLPTTDGAFISILQALKKLTVEGNDVFKAATNDAGHFITMAAKVVTNARIRNNTLIVVSSTGAAVGIFITGSASTCTGLVAYNLVSTLDSTAALLMTASLGFVAFENYLATDANASGALWPVVGNPA